MRVNGMMAGGPPEGGEDNIFTRDRPTKGGTWLRRGLLLAGVGFVMMIIYLTQSGTQGRLGAMSPAQRHAFYEETLEAIRVDCLGDGGMRRSQKRCQKLADFVQNFPECDEACRQEIAPLLAPRGG
jgi:hypothetical protein